MKDLVGAPKDGVLVNGDSGNDIELFAVPGVRGCMVVNAHPELKKWCDEHKSPNLFQVAALILLSCIRHQTLHMAKDNLSSTFGSLATSA